jgi:hypothetical protein
MTRNIPNGAANGEGRPASAFNGINQGAGPAQQAPLTPEYQKVFEAAWPTNAGGAAIRHMHPARHAAR